MLGAICGDVIGRPYEFHSTKRIDFDLLNGRSRWSDDTVLTVAVAEALLDGSDVGEALARWARRHKRAGYGPQFRAWMTAEVRRPYGSWGNGSAMRFSPAGWLAADAAEAATLGAMTAAPMHDHHHGLRGARAVAVRMALEGWRADEIHDVITD